MACSANQEQVFSLLDQSGVSNFALVESKINKMPATLALRVMLGLIHLFQLCASPIDKSILANGIV